MLLELPEEKIQEIEKGSALVELEYIHRMLVVFGFYGSWFFTDEFNKKWCEDTEIYDRWLETGSSNWKFAEQFYNPWEQGKMEPKLQYEDFVAWLTAASTMWKHFYSKKEFSEQDKKTIDQHRDLVKGLNHGARSEIDYFLNKWKEK